MTEEIYQVFSVCPTQKDISDDEYLQGAVQDFVDWGSWLVPEALSEDSSVFI